MQEIQKYKTIMYFSPRETFLRLQTGSAEQLVIVCVDTTTQIYNTNKKDEEGGCIYL